MKTDKHFMELIKDFRNIEFSNPRDILHKNSTENGLTYYGVYQSAHPSLPIWSLIQANIDDAHGSLKKASEFLSQIEEVQDEVNKFYFYNYYLKLGLDKLEDYKIIKKIFFFGIVQNSFKRPILYAQKIVGIIEDGYLGDVTAKAINNYNSKDFIEKYIVLECEYFLNLVKHDLFEGGGKKGFFRYFHGWLNRSFK